MLYIYIPVILSKFTRLSRTDYDINKFISSLRDLDKRFQRNMNENSFEELLLSINTFARTCSRIEKVSLFVHREFDDEISKMLTRGRNLKVYATSVVRKRLRIRIQEDVFVEEVHVKLASSPSPRRFQRDESFSGIRFYLPPHAKIPTYNSIHWEFTWHMVPISCCLIIVI